MLDEKKVSEIDNNAEILTDNVAEMSDSLKKALDLVTDLRSKYEFHAQARPSNKVPKKLDWPLYSGQDDDIHNSFTWICHYETIMIKLNMIEDYLIKGAKCSNESYKALNGISGATGSSLMSFIENDD